MAVLQTMNLEASAPSDVKQNIESLMVSFRREKERGRQSLGTRKGN